MAPMPPLRRLRLRSSRLAPPLIKLIAIQLAISILVSIAFTFWKHEDEHVPSFNHPPEFDAQSSIRGVADAASERSSNGIKKIMKRMHEHEEELMALSQELKQMSDRVSQLENASGDGDGGGSGSGANSSEKKNSNKNKVPFKQPEMEPKSIATVKDHEPKKWLGAAAMEGRQCHPIRDLPDVPWVNPIKNQPPHIVAALVAAAPAKWDNAQCIQYECEWKNPLCDTVAPTNYNGPEPPCCVHTLRDMAKAFDDAMCELGFEYFASYGMLLGLVRSDRLIPWTSDNDYIVTKQTISAIMSLAPEEKAVFDKHGISLFYDGLYYRVCITPTFMEGKLATSWRKKSYEWHPMVPYPYADVFIAHEEAGYMVDELGCAHPMENFRPALHMGVYNNSFSVSVPRDQEAVLSSLYGTEWRTPDAKKSPHGDTKCRGNQMKLEEESEEHNWRKVNE